MSSNRRFGSFCLWFVACNGVSMLLVSSEVQKQSINGFVEAGSLSRRYQLTPRGQFVPIGLALGDNDVNINNGTVGAVAGNDTALSTPPPQGVAPNASEKVSFVAWPLRRRPASRKFRPLQPSSTTRRPLVKLIRPRPTRPAMYSLDGFVPRPSLKKILGPTTTTESPQDRYFRGKYDLQALDSVQKKRKVKFRNEVGGRPEERKKFGSRDQHRKKRPVTRHKSYARKGVAGKDYPVLATVPDTGFDCTDRRGTYADPGTGCQAWYMCPGSGSSHRHSFLCPNGTIFSQGKGVCDWWYNVDCPLQF